MILRWISQSTWHLTPNFLLKLFSLDCNTTSWDIKIALNSMKCGDSITDDDKTVYREKKKCVQWKLTALSSSLCSKLYFIEKWISSNEKTVSLCLVDFYLNSTKLKQIMVISHYVSLWFHFKSHISFSRTQKNEFCRWEHYIRPCDLFLFCKTLIT